MLLYAFKPLMNSLNPLYKHKKWYLIRLFFFPAITVGTMHSPYNFLYLNKNLFFKQVIYILGFCLFHWLNWLSFYKPMSNLMVAPKPYFIRNFCFPYYIISTIILDNFDRFLTSLIRNRLWGCNYLKPWCTMSFFSYGEIFITTNYTWEN